MVVLQVMETIEKIDDLLRALDRNFENRSNTFSIYQMENMHEVLEEYKDFLERRTVNDM